VPNVDKVDENLTTLWQKNDFAQFKGPCYSTSLT